MFSAQFMAYITQSEKKPQPESEVSIKSPLSGLINIINAVVAKDKKITTYN